MTAKVLIYVEPHPLRNTFMEFCSAGIFMANVFGHERLAGAEHRVFGNRYVLAEIGKHVRIEKFIYPSDAESRTIDSYLEEWNEESINDRTELVNGVGPLSEFYYDILLRIKEGYDFSHVFLWSENGAVRRFCKDHDVSVFHMELGPTRPPFYPTVYIDPLGTNGNTSVSQASLSMLGEVDTSPIETWLALDGGDHGKDPGVKELLTTFSDSGFSELPEEEYVVVALQLADDLNTISHSRFASPREFLEFILPEMERLRLKVFIKGHPAVEYRPYNLVQEVDALTYAINNFTNVEIVDRETSADKFVPLCANAKAVLSINSSVSFESWLIGTPGLTYGKAAYDVNGIFEKKSIEFLRSGHVDFEGIEKVFSFLFDCYFIPYRSERVASFVAELLTRFSGFSVSGEPFIEWLARRDSAEPAALDETRRLLKRMTVLKGLAERTYKERLMVMGNIDLFNKEKVGGAFSVNIRGWLADFGVARRKNKAEEIGLLYRDELVGISPFLPRTDVVEHFPGVNSSCGFAFSVRLPSDFKPRHLRLVVLGEDCAYTARLAGLEIRRKFRFLANRLLSVDRERQFRRS